MTNHLVVWASHYSKGSGGWALGFLEFPHPLRILLSATRFV